MSNLGAKVKDILHKDRSDDTTTPHPPGSFPTEDMEPSETEQGWSKGHEHNKLHKADDPRGWTENDTEASRGHGYKDSGVGLTQSDDRTSYKPTQDPMSDRRNEPLSDRYNEPLPDRRNEPLSDRSNNPLSDRRDDTLNRTTESGALGQKDPLAPSTEEHPYWGDLPSRGGVHNSVIGHGSREDEERRHKAIHSGATEPTRTSGTLESGTLLSRRDRDEASTNTQPYGGRPDDRQRLDERTSGSHFKEGFAGAGAAGTAAYGAHELNKRHDDNEESRRLDQTTDRSQPEEHKQRAFPLLGKDHKESHHTEKVKEDKHKDKDHNSKLGGLFGRKSSKDETARVDEQDRDKYQHSKTGPALGAAGAVGAAGAYAATRDRDDDNRRDITTQRYEDLPAQDTHKDDKQHGSKLGALFHRKGSKDETDRTEDFDNDKHHHSKTGPALAAAGAGGAYAATRNRHEDDNNRRDPTTGAYQDPSTTQHSTVYPAAGLDSTRDYNTQNPSSGGIQQKPYRQEDIDHHRGSGVPTGAAAGLDSTRDYNTQNPSSGGIQQKPYRQEDVDHHRGSGLATGAAAGLGAGALASHYGRRDDDRSAAQPMTGYDKQSYDPNAVSQSHQQQGSQHLQGLSAPAVVGYTDPSERQNTHGAQSANFSHKDPVGQTQQHDSHRGAGIAAGTAAAGLGAGALASRSGRDHNEHSGLDSNRGLENQSAYPTEGSAINQSSRSYEQQDSNRGTGFGPGAGAGAALGAGALASRSGRDHDERSGLGSNRGFESGDAYSSERSAMNPGSQSYEQRDSHRGAGLATGAAAGFGGGALASHAADHRRENDQFNTGNDQRDFQTGNTTSGLGNTGSGVGNNPGMSNTSGFDSSNKQALPGSQHESEPFTERKQEHDHTLMDNANSGKYNKLASGTPSGIAYD